MEPGHDTSGALPPQLHDMDSTCAASKQNAHCELCYNLGISRHRLSKLQQSQSEGKPESSSITLHFRLRQKLRRLCCDKYFLEKIWITGCCLTLGFYYEYLNLDLT